MFSRHSSSDGRCRICGGGDLSPMFRVANCNLERCQRCEFAQVANQPSAETLAEIYSRSYFDRGKYDDDENQRRENQKRLKMLADLTLGANARVLDAGCATGDFLVAAGPTYDLWGIDISPDAVEIARRRNPTIADRIAAVAIEAVEFAPGSFDAIVLWDVIEHLWQPLKTCRQLVRLLKPGGYLLMSTPDIGTVTARLMGKRWAFMTPPEHLGFFNRRSFRWMFERELGMTTVTSFATGKWVNAGFLSYKLRRVFPDLVPGFLVSAVQNSPLGRLSLYVPTRDIRYIAARKAEE